MNQPDPQKVLIEACVGSLAGARLAQSAGADRIELNLALELDGLTPSAGLVDLVVSELSIPVITMARPRAGDFCYTEDEWKTLKSDVRWLLENGASGIAFGCLDVDRNVDLARCHEIRELTGDHILVFHKAFDDVADWSEGLEKLIESGVDRVMTSGQKPTAMEGLDTIAKVVEMADGRIEILPAGRVGSQNAAEIVSATGCDQLHGSFSSGGSGGKAEEIRAAIASLAER